MRRTLSAAALAVTFGACGIANAQMSPPLDTSPNNITVRGGVGIPADSSLSQSSSSFMNLGIDYLFNQSLIKGGDTYLSVDAFFSDFSQVVAWPLAVNQRFYTGRNAQGHRSYLFVGVGITFIDATTSGSAIGGRAGLGTELGPNIIAEIAGYVSDRVNGARANAVTFNIGYRF